MSRKLSSALLALAIVWACGSGLPVAAQSPAFDSSKLGVKGATAVDEEYVRNNADEWPTNRAYPSAARWNELAESSKYSYRNKLEYVPPKQPKVEENWLSRTLTSVFQFLNTDMGRALLWLILVVFVGFVAWRLLREYGGHWFARKERNSAPDENSLAGNLSVDELNSHDFEQRMQEAIQLQAFRDAIRFGYLGLLQSLHEKEKINYRPDKTNRDYIREIQDVRLAGIFRQATRRYEWTWFGNVQPDQAQMNSFLENFNQLQRCLDEA